MASSVFWEIKNINKKSASSVFHKSGLFFFSHILIFRNSVFYISSVATLTLLLTMNLMKGLMMHIIGQEQHYFGLLQCTFKILLVSSNRAEYLSSQY